MPRKNWPLAGLALGGLLGCLILLPCVERTPGGGRLADTSNRLRQIGLALRNYHEVKGRLPPAVVRGKDGEPLYSWRVLLLPFLEEEVLYQQFRRDEPWDSPHNLALARETPRCYRIFGSQDHPGLTRFLAFVGPGTGFERPGLTWIDFPDGPGNTLLVAETADPVPWSKPVDLEYRPDQPLPRLGTGLVNPVKLLCYEVGRTSGFVACLGDGTTTFVADDVGEATLWGLITRDGGEPVDVSGLD